jgi:hypothetical protein
MKHARTVARATTLCLIGGAAFAAFFHLDRWAAFAFARPLMGSALVAVLELGIVLVAIMLAPAVSMVVELALGGRSGSASPPRSDE